MVTAERLAARRKEIGRSTDLRALLAHLTERAAPVLARMPHVPEEKALLSTDGGVCPDDGAPLVFDPWSPHAHRCARCGRTFTGERHDRNWARYQHLWLAERAAHLAALAALDGNEAAGARAAEILRAYARSYMRYPNRDNVLGPSRLFFSTYLESLWVCNYLAAAVLLRESGRLDDATERGVAQVADEAANLIGEFDEGFSNRQTWNDAALAAIAAWFEDEDLARRAIESPTGLLAHLLRGFGRDGMWYEGENYHLFALRGLLTGAAWAGEAGVELCAEPQLARRVRAALLAPARTALPDFSFPARKDSRFGVSLAQPMYLELWEVGLANLGSRERGAGSGELESWLRALYSGPEPNPEPFESYLHDAPIEPLPALLPEQTVVVGPAVYDAGAACRSGPLVSRQRAPRIAGARRAAQGRSLRERRVRPVGRRARAPRSPAPHAPRGRRPLVARSGHGRLRRARPLLVPVHAGAQRSPARRGLPTGRRCDLRDVRRRGRGRRGRRVGLDARPLRRRDPHGRNGSGLRARRGRAREPRRPPHRAAVAFSGDGGRGTWTSGELADEFVSRVERFVPASSGSVVLELAEGSRVLKVFLLFDGELLRAEGPGLPGSGTRTTFYLARARGRSARFVTVLEPVGEGSVVRAVRTQGGVIEVEIGDGTHRHAATPGGWEIDTGSGRVRLGGPREPEPPLAPLLELDRPTRAVGAALRVSEPPPLDGSVTGFDTSEPLRLDLEDQYRRSEEPYSGPEDFSAAAFAAWDDDALYLAVEVTKPDVCFRPPDAPPLRLDNHPDDVHSDGLQLYLRDPEGGDVTGFLVVPEGKDGARLRARGAGEAPGMPDAIRGAWRRTREGYRVTLAVAWPEWHRAHVGGRVGFDLVINEMLPGRVRRAGQLVWSGGNGWVWLRGDRQDPERFGVLELVG